MAFRRRQLNKRAFTLVELVITMALFAVVSALVISFIVFLSQFTNSNNDQSERLADLAVMRKEIDLWFSFYDNADYEITLSPEGGAPVYAQKSGEGVRYGLSATGGEGGEGVLTCVYPSSALFGSPAQITQNGETYSVRTQQTTFTDFAITFQEYSEGYRYTDYDGIYLRFLITLPVRGRQFACTILYL